ncbi:unnamed protein product [Lota lota]
MPAAFIWLIKGPSAIGRQHRGKRDPGTAPLLLQPSNLIVETITASQDPISGGWSDSELQSVPRALEKDIQVWCKVPGTITIDPMVSSRGAVM